MKLNMRTFDVEFNYLEDDEWCFGCCLVTCPDEEQIADTLGGRYEEVEVLDYVEVQG